jgi:hypothetical protein
MTLLAGADAHAMMAGHEAVLPEVIMSALGHGRVAMPLILRHRAPHTAPRVPR